MTTVSRRNARRALRGEGTPSRARLVVRRFLRHRLAIVGSVILIAMAVACYGASLLAPYPPNLQDIGLGPTVPSAAHWLGTDSLGRDFLTELLYAGQVSLGIGVAVAVVSTTIGVAIGAVAGYAGGAVDNALMRFVDLMLVVPAIAILAVALRGLGSSPLTIVIVLGALGWMPVARVVRSQVLSLREREFIDAVRVVGARPLRILARHMLPNLAGVVVVNMSLAVAGAIIVESTLSFLGFGVQPPQSSWGRMLSDAAGLVGTGQVYQLYFPGMFVLVTVLAINFVGDGLRDAFDPRGSRR